MSEAWDGERPDRDELTVDGALQTAINAFIRTDYEKASAAALIAQAMTFHAEVKDEAEQAVRRAEKVLRDESSAIHRLDEVERILARAKEQSPRHPAIHKALEVIHGG